MIRTIALMAVLLTALPTTAQDEDLLQLLGEEEQEPEYTNASFKTTRVINAHSLENTAHGVLDFRIGHRFGYLNTGISEFFGLDQATIRLGLDYGVTDRLVVGIGRSSYQKTVDGFAKYKFLRQCDAGCSMPITLAFVAASSINTTQQSDYWTDTTKTYYFSHRVAYSFMLLIGRKFNEKFSLQLNPGLVHRNLVATTEEENDVFHVSGAGRMKLNKRIALNAEYFYVLPGQTRASDVPADRADDPNPGYKNSFSIGFDIETGGHVFQLHFTNSTAMFERGFITETTGDWLDGDVHFGFNISRVFTLHTPKKPPVD